MKIAIIGFGEAGHMFGQHLSQYADVHAYDVIQDDEMKSKAIAAGVTFQDTLSELITGAELVLSLVTANQAPTAACQAGVYLQPIQYFLEMNSIAPGTKQDNAKH